MNKKMKKEKLLIGVLLGILLLVIVLPVPNDADANESDLKSPESVENTKMNEQEDLEQPLKEILQKISGVGQVEVFITYKDSGKIVVEKDESVSEELIQEADANGGTRTTTTNQKEHKTIYGTGDLPYVIQKLSPAVEGVLVVAEGGGQASVKKQIQETIEALFGLDAHKISIMKMEVLK